MFPSLSSKTWLPNLDLPVLHILSVFHNSRRKQPYNLRVSGMLMVGSRYCLFILALSPALVPSDIIVATMASNMGYDLLLTVISTLRDKDGVAPLDHPAAPSPNPQFQFGVQLGGGALQWNAAGTGGSLILVPPSGSVSPFTGRHVPAPSAPPPPPIEDRPAAPSLASVRPSPFPGPINVGKGHGKVPPVVPGQSSNSLPVTNHHLLPPSAPRLDEVRPSLQNSHSSSMHHSTSGDRLHGVIDRWFADKGYGFICADKGGDDVFLHKSAIRRKDLHLPAQHGRVSFTQIFDPQKQKVKVVSIRFLSPSHTPASSRQPSRSLSRSPSRRSRSISLGRRPRKPSFSRGGKRRLSSPRASHSPPKQNSPRRKSQPRHTNAIPLNLDASVGNAVPPTSSTTNSYAPTGSATATPPPLAAQPPSLPLPQIGGPHDDINSKASQSERSTFRHFIVTIARVCLKDLSPRSVNRTPAPLRTVCEDIDIKFCIQVAPEVLSRLFRHCPAMVSSMVDGFEVVCEVSQEQIPVLAHFCMINSTQILRLPKSLSAWNTSHLFYSHSQVLGFGHASGSPIPTEAVAPSASLSDSVVSEEASITPRLIVDLGDPSYHSNPVVPMCAKTHEFLRLIRVLIRDMVDILGMSNDAGFVTIGDLVQMLVAWGSDANDEQVLDLLTKVGSQFLEVRHDDTTILINDKSHESVPSIATFKSTPSHVPPEALPHATVAATPRTRSAVIQHALRWVISTGTLATSPNGAVEFNQFIDALGALDRGSYT